MATALRRLRLLSLPLGTAAFGAWARLAALAGADADEVRAELRQRNAERTRATLGELKGGALKAGQLLSTVDALLPQDPEASWSAALGELQEVGVPIAFRELAPVLFAELGTSWRRDLVALDPTPVAAASLGQVHRGRWRDGREVAVKIQYPGVAEAVASDVGTVAAMSRLAARIAPSLALPPLVDELRTRLAEELDYTREAAVQTRFVEGFADDPGVVVPEVVAASRRVLVSTWLGGTPIASLASAPPAQRDAAARAYQRFLVAGPAYAGWLHTDPHPGNFRVLDDGALGVMDFGSALAMPDGMPPSFGRLLAALIADSPDEVGAALEDAGFVEPGSAVEVDKLLDYMRPFTEPAAATEFTFTRSWLRGQFGRVNDPRNPDFGVALQLRMPAEHLFTHRVWLGMVGVLCHLEATVPVAEVLERWLPGFHRPVEPVPTGG